jgi:hypothetical protein
MRLLCAVCWSACNDSSQQIKLQVRTSFTMILIEEPDTQHILLFADDGSDKARQLVELIHARAALCASG